MAACGAVITLTGSTESRIARASGGCRGALDGVRVERLWCDVRVVRPLPSDGDVWSIDVDGLDPSVAPASRWPQPGGLSFRHVAGIIGELSRTSGIIGGDVVELLPSRDVNGSRHSRNPSADVAGGQRLSGGA